MTEFQVRSAASRDADRVYLVHKQSISRLCSGTYSPRQISEWSELRTPRDYEASIRDGWVMVAEGAEGVVGFAVFRPDIGELDALYVHPDCVSRGIGTLLLAAVESQARSRGLSAITLNATLNSAAFYERRGYSSLGATTYELPSGIELSCVRMQKGLTST